MVYGIVFFITTVLSLATDFLRKYNSRFLAGLTSFFAVLVVSGLSGLRDNTIGTDMQVYGDIVFRAAQRYADFHSFYSGSVGVFKLEAGYMFLNFVVSRFTTQASWFYFTCAFLTNGLFYYGFQKVRSYMNPSLGWFSYLLLFYGSTFNVIRQSLALAVIFFGFTTLLTGKKYKGLFFMFTAVFFHSSSLIACILLLTLFTVIKKGRQPEYVVLLIFLGSIVLYLTFTPLVQFLLSVGLVPSRYSVYLGGYSDGAGFSPVSMLFKACVGFVFVWRYPDIVKKDRLLLFFFITFILDFFFYQLRIFSVVFSRLSFYFFIFQFLSVPWIIKRIRNSLDRHVLLVLYIFYLIITWYYQIVISGNNEIYPYRSILLNIF